MTAKRNQFTLKLRTAMTTPRSPNFLAPSLRPSGDWPVVLDERGEVVSRWGDPVWDLTRWAGKKATLNFCNYSAKDGKQAISLGPANSDLLRVLATWMIWGNRAGITVRTVAQYLSALKQIVALCSQNGISADRLARHQAIIEKVPEVIAPSCYQNAIVLLDAIYTDREQLGFSILDPAGIAYLVANQPRHEVVQTPYIPPRIWLYQLERLRECLTDFLAHRTQVEECFRFCIDLYIKQYGSLEDALAPGAKLLSPFDFERRRQKGYPGSFREVAKSFGVDNLFAKWYGVESGRAVGPKLFSSYLSCVTVAGLAYIANFTLQRKEEIASLRTSCLIWDEDEKLGRVPIICGVTTKTDCDSDARWVASPSVAIAIDALSAIAHLRMTCDRVNLAIRPTEADQQDPYLYSTATEPWGTGRAHAKPYSVRTRFFDILHVLNGLCAKLFDPEQMRITPEDLAVARRLTPNLSVEAGFEVGQVWPLSWHQYRRTGCVNMFASGDISDSTIQQQMKHSNRMMPLYYGRNHRQLHLNKEVQRSIVIAMYQSQVATLKQAVTEDNFLSPHGSARKEILATTVLSAKDNNDLLKMAKKGLVAYREHRLGGCMKAGVCEYGGIESVARCAGGDGGKPCIDVLYDRKKEPQVRADMRRVTEVLKLLPADSPRYRSLTEERQAMENYLNVIQTC